ncbi:MAG: hypothetical protein ABL958_21835 [Bdellovibrionia bacterium]
MKKLAIAALILAVGSTAGAGNNKSLKKNLNSGGDRVEGNGGDRTETRMAPDRMGAGPGAAVTGESSWEDDSSDMAGTSNIDGTSGTGWATPVPKAEEEDDRKSIDRTPDEGARNGKSL